ncbi:MAG: DUF881 domain-containing protein [Firmicutes bacterium]|nr:DUF881 domain-containing protein [Bacillota bacterium]
MSKSNQTMSIKNVFIILIFFMLLLNIVLLAGGGYLLYRQLNPTAEKDLISKQEAAYDLVEYNRRLAQSLGVENRAQVHEALSRFSYEIQLVTNADELNKAILANGNRTQEKILEEFETKQRETVLAFVNQDPNVMALENKSKFSVKLGREDGVQVEPEGILTPETIEKIADNIAVGDLVQNLTVDIEVENGKGQLVVPLSVADQIRALNREIDSLRVTVHDLRTQAGFAPMSGPGIIVRIYDAEDGYTNDTIVHETDIRDTINELFAAGANGIAVGGQRLTATSAIRCVGPSILVNDERIAVNPVEIHAIGDPAVLSSGLDIMRITLELSRQLRVEIDEVENLTLPAYIKR